MATAAAVIAGVPAVAMAGPLPVAVGSTGVVFYTPVAGQIAGTSTVHVVLGAGSSVDHVALAYSTDASHTIWSTPTVLPNRDPITDVFETNLSSLPAGPVELKATAYDASGTALGAETEDVTASPTATRFTFKPLGTNVPIGVFQRADGHWLAAVSGTTSGTTAPTAVDAVGAPSGTTVPSAPSAARVTARKVALSSPTGSFTAPNFTLPVDLTATAALGTPSEAVVRVGDATSSDAFPTPVYAQVVTAVRATTQAVPGTGNIAITATVTDQYGQPIVGVPLRLVGHEAGISTAVNQLAVSDVRGQVTFAGRSGAGGYTAGGYTVYGDLNVNDLKGPHELSFPIVHGTVSYAMPGRSLYHNDKRIKKAGGVYNDAAKGTKAAHARGFGWIDQDGQLSFATKAGKRTGRISQASDLVWVNAHGNPFNPKWMKKGRRFESYPWSKLKKHKGLRNANKTFRQDAAAHLGVEWEVKDVHPLSKGATLNAAFNSLAASAQRYYGAGWRNWVQIKVLSNLHGGQKYALKVLKHAHKQGFTTIFLARGKTTRLQIPASAQSYVTYVRGAVGGEYPAVPSAVAPAPVRVRTPPAVTVPAALRK